MAFGDNKKDTAKKESTHVAHFSIVAKDGTEYPLYKLFQMFSWPEKAEDIETHKFNSDAEYLMCKALLAGKSEFSLKTTVSKVGVVKDRSELETVEL